MKSRKQKEKEEEGRMEKIEMNLIGVVMISMEYGLIEVVQRLGGKR